MSSELHDTPRQNRILAALPAGEYSRLEDDLEWVALSAGQIVHQSGGNQPYVYFPTSSILSRIATGADGASAELAMTGCDGLVGIPLVLGGETSNYKVIVQRPGQAYRLRSEVVCWELDQGGSLRRLCLCYIQAVMTQMAQSVLCYRHHSVDQQLCRWLLQSLDQIPGTVLDVTQEMISSFLGVRREGVTEAAGKLQAAGLIQYRRGHITVTDRPGLEARVCECYAVVRAEYARLFGLVTTSLARQRPRPNPATLRQRAEARLRQSPPGLVSGQWDTAHLLHELQVHQIELEMHNEELRHAYDEADSLREKYADLYDFAPVGYVTLDAEGSILQINLAGAIMLGIKRSQMGKLRFAAFVNPDCLSRFNAFVGEVLGGRNRSKCEIILAQTAHRPALRARIEAVADEARGECRMVVMEAIDKRLPQSAAQRPQAGPDVRGAQDVLQ